jgi:hypothetical protein
MQRNKFEDTQQSESWLRFAIQNGPLRRSLFGSLTIRLNMPVVRIRKILV